MADKTGKGKLLLRQKIDPRHLLPDFVARWLFNRQDFFFEFSLYENGIEFRYSGKSKKPLFVEYPKIKRVYFTTKDYFKIYEDIEKFPAWVTISAPPRLISTYPSPQLKVERIRKIFEGHGCTIEKRILTNTRNVYDYSIKRYSFNHDGFDIVFYDGRKKNYLWDDVKNVSDLTSDPYKIEFFCGDKLLLYPLELEFISMFRKEYDDYLERST